MDFDALLVTLPLMVKGMAGVFIVTAVIILSMYLLNKLSGRGKNK